MQTHAQSLATQQNISDTRILHLGHASLLPVVERDVPHVSLHLLQRQADAVMVVVGDGVVRRELDKVVGLELDDVGEEVAALEGEVLHDEVERVVGVLDARNRDVANLEDVS